MCFCNNVTIYNNVTIQDLNLESMFCIEDGNIFTIFCDGEAYKCLLKHLYA